MSSTDKVCPAIDSVVIEVGNVTADFEIDSTKKPLFCFNNLSENSTSHRWSFYNPKDIMTLDSGNRLFIANGNSADYDQPQICEDYRDSLGVYWVCLEATNDIGCKDTICKKVYNDFKASIIIPNVFTPNKKKDNFAGLDPDGLEGNEFFNISIEGEEKYDLVIFDRWGVKVFSSTDKNKDWNGKVNNSGAECPDGTYYYIFKYRFKGNDKDEPVLNGVVRIIR
ncbi:MAG: gliding motility-associated C-terminal domain-containing protein [Bacteroidia bacterium]